jgi:DNA-binding transcriptional LysR family regulator
MTKGGAILSKISPLRLLLPGSGNARRRRIENYLTANQIEVSDLMELDTMHGTLDMVAKTDWVTILPGIMCLPDLEGGPRKVAPLADPPLMVDYMRIETRKRPLTAAAQAFADLLQEELNSALEIDPFSQV